MENGQPIQISETAPKGGGTGRDTNAPVIAPPKAKVLFQKVFGSPTDDSLTKSVRSFDLWDSDWIRRILYG